jgi:glycosyltransferase involved in cell wall biosynthesis
VLPDSQTPRVLFILRRRDFAYSSDTTYTVRSSGLKNSAAFVRDALISAGFTAKLVEVTDNNDIDREVTIFGPTHCIIEALWVVPEKFDVLRPLHPDVIWCVRNHSEVPFMAVDGVAMGWAIDYLRNGILFSSNSPRATDEVRLLGEVGTTLELRGLRDLTPYLPNIYVWPKTLPPRPSPSPGVLRVGCFGALRPLKNHLMQALAAIDCAEQRGVALEFHINSSRIESGGDPVLKNLKELFKRLHNHKLVEHDWLDHAEFLATVASVDISLQVSFTETFNIVSADAVAVGTPVVATEEVDWLDRTFWASPTSLDSIVRAMNRALDGSVSQWSHSKNKLIAANATAIDIWEEWLFFGMSR